MAEKPVITDDSNQLEPSLLDELLTNISTLSSVYHKPPEAFVTRLKTTVQKTEDEDFAEGSEAGYSSGNPADSAASLQLPWDMAHTLEVDNQPLHRRPQLLCPIC